MKKEKLILGIGLFSWIASWIILSFKLDTITYLGFMLFGMGISGITIYFSLKFALLNEEKK